MRMKKALIELTIAISSSPSSSPLARKSSVQPTGAMVSVVRHHAYLSAKMIAITNRKIR